MQSPFAAKGLEPSEGTRKPSSVLVGHLSGTPVSRRLVRPTRGSNAAGHRSPPAWPCSEWGLPCPAGYPVERWALTPPFHPYPPRTPRRICSGRSVLCGTFRRLAPPGSYPAPCPMELGLSSSRAPQRRRPAAHRPLAGAEISGSQMHRSRRGEALLHFRVSATRLPPRHGV